MLRLKFLGINIAKYRIAKKFSQEKLAEKVEFSREYIARIEGGQKFVSLKKMFLIADVLEVKVSDLINFD